MMNTTERDLAQELINSQQIREKCQQVQYAQNLYAALCNNLWQPREVWPILTNQQWSISWRGAGGLVADIRNQIPFVDGARTEDYLVWYCSGLTPEYNDLYVSEGVIVEEIQQDLAQLGWHPVAHSDYE